MAFIDYYKILNVSEKATPDDIKIAFKKQAMKWHPDRNKYRYNCSNASYK